MEQHIARRTTASAKPSSHSSHDHRQSRRQSSVLAPQQQQQQQHSSSQRKSRHHEPRHESSKRRSTQPQQQPQQFAPVVTGAERAIGKGASLPVVDEKGQVWYDWEEKQEFTPLITVEHERSGWVNFPGAAGRRSSSSSHTHSHSDGEGDSESASPLRPAFPVPLPLPLHTVFDAFTFSRHGGGGDNASAATAAAIDPKDPMHGLQVPPGSRPRGKDRRIVRRADSLPSLLDRAEEKEAAAREFLDASFDPSKTMRAIQQQQQQQQQRQQVTAAAAASAVAPDASAVQNKQLAFGKRASMSVKGIKKLFSRKKSTSA